MEKLIELMKRALAENFALYLKGQYYHWNVEGPNFKQFHDLFGDFYSEVYGAVDQMAEEIRALDAYAPGSLGRFMELSTIDDENTVPKALEMVKRLADDNQKILVTLQTARDKADELGQNGLVNFLEDRLDNHKKHAWMLRATLKGE